MQFTDVLKTRVSTRSFDSRPVPDGAVQGLVEAALYAPVGMHRFETLHLTVQVRSRLHLMHIMRGLRHLSTVTAVARKLDGDKRLVLPAGD